MIGKRLKPLFEGVRELASRLVFDRWSRVTDRELVVAIQELVTTGTELREGMRLIMAALADLTASVQAQGTVIQSAVTLMTGLSEAIKTAGTDPVALEALRADIEAQTSALANAVAANTPSEEVPDETPAEETPADEVPAEEVPEDPDAPHVTPFDN